MLSDSDSDTATEGEEEIRARELRRQEVRVAPPVVQTDTGTDTEVKKSLDILPPEIVPDIINNHNRLDISKILPLNKSPSNYSINSDIFNSAESDLDINMNRTSAHEPNVVVGKLTITPKADSKPPLDNKHLKSSPLAKSATAGNLNISKPKRNFVLPPREQRRSFGQEFTPKFKLEEPLLVIKRTPSKVNLPKEIKPKVAVNTKVLDTKKYFGAPKNIQKSKLLRSDTNAVRAKPPLVKQTSLPVTTDEINEDIKSFNFDLKDSDLDDIDNYIEDLLTKEDELENPIDSNKYVSKPESHKDQEENVSSSFEDLFSALEKETDVTEREQVKESDEKIEDLLKWMEELDHQTPERKVYRSVSDVKYKNLESLLRKPERFDSVVSKIPKNNVAFFEAILKGKDVPKDSSDEDLYEPPSRGLCRSKTEVHFNRGKIPRTSVDLDAVSKVNIKTVLKKFESFDQEDEAPKPKPEKPVIKRLSLGNFKSNIRVDEPKKISVKPKPIANTIKKFESEPKEFKKLKHRIHEPKRVLTTKYDEKSFEDTIKDLEKFVDDTIESIGKNDRKPKPKSNELGKSKSDWCVNVTVSSKVSPEFLKMQQEVADKKEKESVQKINALPLPNSATEINKEPSKDSSNKVEEMGHVDFAKELKDFQEAMSALTDETSRSEPHNCKAIDSSEISSKENTEKHTDLEESSISSEYKPEANMPQDFSQAVESSSLEGILDRHVVQNSSIENENETLLAIKEKSILEEDETGIKAEKTVGYVNLEDLYVNVNKPKKEVPYSPPVPRRRKHSHDGLSGPHPPPRAHRQKSQEHKVNSENEVPIAPHRKRCNTVSPLPRRKNETGELRSLDNNGRSTSTSNLEVKKAIVSSYNLPGPQAVCINGPKSHSTENIQKFPPKYGRKDKDKDCCIQ